MLKIQQILSENIKKNRVKRNLTQAQLAEKCNISTTFLGYIETGKKFPSPENLQKIAEAMGLKYFELFVEDETENPRKVIHQAFEEVKKNIIKDIDSVYTQIAKDQDWKSQSEKILRLHAENPVKSYRLEGGNPSLPNSEIFLRFFAEKPV